MKCQEVRANWTSGQQVLAKWLISSTLAFATLVLGEAAYAKDHLLKSVDDIKPVLQALEPGDSIILKNGVWKDAELKFESVTGEADYPVTIRAETPGQVVFTGTSHFRLSGKHVVVSGFVFRNPNSVSDVFDLRSHSQRHAHHCRVTDCVFEQTNPGNKNESRWLNIYGTHNRVDHCYFAGKQNQGATTVVWVEENPGRHRIDHNHFGERPELGSNGGETLRIGTSQVSELSSQTLVEHNYFEQCNGEAETISNKSCDNTYRFNLFERCEGTLTLRHGHRCQVDANIFLGHKLSGTGGVRIIGEGHRVTNNYFEGLRGDAERAALSIMNGILNSPLNGYAPVRDGVIAHNTFIDCKVSMEFGVRASKKVSVAPSDCLVSHNVFAPGKWELFRVQAEPTNFKWIGNKYQTGKTRGADLIEIERIDIPFERDQSGLLRPLNEDSVLSPSTSGIETDIDGRTRDSRFAGCDDPTNKPRLHKTRIEAGPRWRP